MPEAKPDKRKQSLYFPTAMLDEIAAEARRLDRSMSWVVQRAWKLSRRARRGDGSRKNAPVVGPTHSLV